MIAVTLLVLTLTVGIGSLFGTIEMAIKNELDTSLPIYGFVLVCVGLTLAAFNWIGFVVSVIGFVLYLYSNNNISKEQDRIENK